MGAPELFEWRGYTKPRVGVASCKRMPYRNDATGESALMGDDHRGKLATVADSDFRTTHRRLETPRVPEN